jgi:hypothetical protein
MTKKKQNSKPGMIDMSECFAPHGDLSGITYPPLPVDARSASRKRDKDEIPSSTVWTYHAGPCEPSHIATSPALFSFEEYQERRDAHNVTARAHAESQTMEEDNVGFEAKNCDKPRKRRRTRKTATETRVQVTTPDHLRQLGTIVTSKHGYFTLTHRPRLLTIGKFFAYRALPDKQIQILTRIEPFVTEQLLTQELIPRLNRTKRMASLRLIDWLVVDYAREKDVGYMIQTRAESVLSVDVHALYNEWLSLWRKRNYDVCRRRIRIYFTVQGQTYSTSVAQLHFFSMANEYGILQYVERYRALIRAHMDACTKTMSVKKFRMLHKGQRFKRCSLAGQCRPRAFAIHGSNTVMFQSESEPSCAPDDMEAAIAAPECATLPVDEPVSGQEPCVSNKSESASCSDFDDDSDSDSDSSSGDDDEDEDVEDVDASEDDEDDD